MGVCPPPNTHTMGSGTLVCDTWTQIGPFRGKSKIIFLYFIFERFSLTNLERFSMKCSNFVNFLFLKFVRISPEIDWYHYQSVNAAPTAIVQHQIKTHPFWQSVTSEPTVPPIKKFFNPTPLIKNFFDPLHTTFLLKNGDFIKKVLPFFFF